MHHLIRFPRERRVTPPRPRASESRIRAVCLGFALLGLSSGAAQAQVITEFGYGTTVIRSSTCETPGAAQAARSAS